MSPYLRPVAAVAALAGLGAYAIIMLKGPQGLSALTEKHHEISTLEEQNAELEREIDTKRQRIDRLKHDSNAQELEVRKRLKMGKEGEMHFILPERRSETISPNDK